MKNSIEQSVRNCVLFLEEMTRNLSRIVEEEGVSGQVKESPLGVVLCMGPYNYPLNETPDTFCFQHF